ncbi:MAG: hypothetical protein AB7O43_01820 [Hyphomicrobiaceae bacterium]
MYTVEELASDIRSDLASAPGRSGREKVLEHVAKALSDTEFVDKYLINRPADAGPRQVLYEDPELGFCICGHAYGDKAYGKPHDHGPAWAIYGQATGVTEMTEWKVVEKGSGEKPTRVVPEKTYEMKPGDCHLYDIGDIHSPKREAPTRLLRIEGKNLENAKRSNIKAA